MLRAITIIFIFTIYSSAQTVTVKDEKTQKPLELVSVYSGDLNRALTTDSKGKVDISIFNNSNVIVFRLLGYKILKFSPDELSKTNYTVLMKEQPVAIANVVVSANRWAEDRGDIAQTIEIITPKDVELQNPQTVADMLSMTGSVYVQKSQLGGGSPMIRGFATNRVLLVVDNVRMNNAIFRSGNIQNIIAIDANSLSNAQVFFGPGSVIFGSDAIGGVMAFNTRSPQFSYSSKPLFKAGALARYSSANNENTGSVNLSIGFEKLAFHSSFTYSKFGDLTMGSIGPVDYLRPEYQSRINGIDSAVVNPDPKVQKYSGYNQINFMQKIRFKPNEAWEIDYGLHYSTTADVPRYDRLIEYRNNRFRSGQWYYGPQKWMMNNLTITSFSSNSMFDLSKLIFAYQTFEESRHDRNFRNNILNHRTENVGVFTLNFDMMKNINVNSNVSYGFEAVLNNVASKGESENVVSGQRKARSTRYPDGSVWNSYSVYAAYKNKFSEEFILHSGFRYALVHTSSKYDTTFFKFPFTSSELTTGALTGSAGLVWHPKQSWQINLNISSGFRAPNIDDIGKVFDSSPSSVVVPNPNLKPEYIYSAELGFIYSFSNSLRIDFAAYYSYLSNALVRRDFQLNGNDSIVYDGKVSRVQAIQNAAFASILGIQAGVDFKLTEGLSFATKFCYQNGEEEDDAGKTVPLRHAAPFFGNARMTYEKGLVNLVLYADYNSEISYDNLAPTEREKTALYAKDSGGRPFSPSWYTINMKLGVKLFDFTVLGLGIENITDQRYRPYSSGISAPGRNFISSIRINL